ncbi:hypothetical protein ALC57_10617, partial [Trachymyrmex cornetzi]
GSPACMQRVRDRLLLNGISAVLIRNPKHGLYLSVAFRAKQKSLFRTLHSGSEVPYQTCRIDSVVNRALN